MKKQTIENQIENLLDKDNFKQKSEKQIEAEKHLKYLLKIGYKADSIIIREFVKKYELGKYLEKLIKND